jgi:methyl-accepting chemotaxis protein
MKWFTNLNAMPKIMSAFGGVLCFLLLIGYLASTQMSQMSNRTLEVFQRDVGGLDAIRQAEVDQTLMSGSLFAAALAAGNNEAVASAEHDFDSRLADLRLSLSSASSRVRANTRDKIQLTILTIPDVERTAREVFGLARSGEHVATVKSLTAALSATDRLSDSINQAIVLKKVNAEIFNANEIRVVQSTRTQFAWLLLGGLLFGTITGLAIARSFSVPLRLVVAVLSQVERGDLTQAVEIDSENEIGLLAKALNSALINIRGTMTQVGEAARSLGSASIQLAKSVEVMAGGAHEQAASLEQTSASLEQITATVRQNSDNARQASQFAISSRDAAEKGGTVVSNAMSAMNEISDASGKIAAIIRVIDEIAFQTNLLAVNASVEAARAREHGKGFAVVATEVRSLAQRSSAAAKEIKALIGDSRRKVENGSTLVNRSGQTLNEIVTSVKRVTDIVSEIAAASREQSTGIEQVNSAMLQMDSVLQSNSSQTEQLSATASSLAADAGHLEQLIGRFIVKPQDVALDGVEKEVAAAPLIAKSSAPLSRMVDPAPAASAALNGLASSLGHTVSTAALDEEFEEF